MSAWAEFGIREEDVTSLDERTTIVKKWNWDYPLAHAFQKHAVKTVLEDPRRRILICTNHPHVFTNGRGLQKPRKGETLDLVEFRPEDYQELPFPLHQIERGGGLTFHHPGQFIFYPILRLSPQALSLSKMTDEIFDFSINVLSSWGLEGLHHSNKLLGLWCGQKKIASMGIAIEKLVTYHGMALNLLNDHPMKAALAQMNPCGLSAGTYASVEEKVTVLPNHPLDRFTESFLEQVKRKWA